jgi:tripartite-type tricarboxylate transporter receptor subunit TctC
MKQFKIIWSVLCTALCSVVCAILVLWPKPGVSADGYPNRPIRLIIPFAPGGATDVVARILGSKLTEKLGQQIVMDIRPGAGSVLGTDIGAKASPDGYTIVLVATAHVLNTGLLARLPYDAITDFSPISMVVESPLIFLVPPNLGVNTIGELIATAKAKPGSMSYGSAGQGTSGHLATELLKLRAGIQMIHVPYKGAGQALIDLLGGQIQMLCTSTVPSLPHVRTGKLKGIAVTTRTRSRAAPEIPTVAESGLPGFQATTWYALLAPAKTPEPIIKTLHLALTQVLRTPAVAEQLIAQGAEPMPNSPDELRHFFKNEIEIWTKVIKQANIRPNT